MARLSPSGGAAPNHTSIDLARLISRLHNTLLEPDGETAHRLRTSVFERNKVGANLEHAKALLDTLAQGSTTTRNSNRRGELNAELSLRQSQLSALDSRLHELNATGQDYDDEPSSSGEDLLGADYTPSESEDASVQHISTGEPTDNEDEEYQRVLADRAAAAQQQPAVVEKEEGRSERGQLFPEGLRTRNNAAQTQSTAHASGNSSSAVPLNEALIDHHRHEQEELTSSLLAMAQALKASSQSFTLTLDEEKEIIDRAGEGLEKNRSGLDAANKRMGYLRQMSEGKGWWGRIMLYAWIFGLMFLAFFIVAFLPKLRF